MSATARFRMASERSSERGFSMLEVLVAILVISVALLAMAGLQGVAIRNNSSAMQRTIATQLAYDMADRMRANNASVFAGNYNYVNYSATNASGVTTATCLTTGCNSQQLANEDIYEWNQQILAQLPQTATTGPWGVVCIDSTPADGTPTAPACDNVAGATYVIKVWWVDDRNAATPTLKQWVTVFQP